MPHLTKTTARFARRPQVKHRQIFLKLPLFRLCEREELLLVIQSLRPGVALPDEALVREGEFGVGLLFLMTGGAVITRRGEFQCFVYAVAAFGEAALLRHARPVATVRAVRYCEVNVLMRTDFERIAAVNPNVLRYLQLYTSQRDALVDEMRLSHANNQASRCSRRRSTAVPISQACDAARKNVSNAASLRNSCARAPSRRVSIRESLNTLVRNARATRSSTSSTVHPSDE